MTNKIKITSNEALTILIDTASTIGYNSTLDDIGYNDNYGNYYICTEDYMFSIFVNDFSQIPTACCVCPYCGDEFLCDIDDDDDTVETIEKKLQDQIDDHKKSKKECGEN